MKESYIYILTNKNKTVTYIGVTSNLKERITQHKNNTGCSFTKKYNVHFLVYIEMFTSIEQAIAREKQLKKWNKSWKWELIKKVNPKLLDLYSDL
ncbi:MULTISPECIES: GIY-YIG nuclease family protein [Flavobacteriaceae]|uniref:GIY-YIG nuclease family protein n=2 Tax=Flavobacteriaceae TaxID=49546 RepID=A0A4Y8AVQ8_9FLAO|nr:MULTISPECIES: GIY-YIG nuclease family protein [Flavobacteriaceae]TEW76581.1 GIY-YIG nuclease family protein [Gramella jeungdoensis]GGK60816.1 endonuclease [Lutibacter litoralis]